jgi:hypothetical protein
LREPTITLGTIFVSASIAIHSQMSPAPGAVFELDPSHGFAKGRITLTLHFLSDLGNSVANCHRHCGDSRMFPDAST